MKESFLKLRSTLRLLSNRLIVLLLGRDVLTAQEISELERAGKLPETSLHLVEKSFVLGRLAALLKKPEYSEITYEELVDNANSVPLSESDQHIIDSLKINATKHIREITDSAERITLDSYHKAYHSGVVEASLKDLPASPIVSVTKAKAVLGLPSALEKELNTPWKLTTETEFHAAKTQGISQTILEKVGVYENVGGPSARVSVIPKDSACADCKKQYLDSTGNPIIFLLEELLSAGSNASNGVTHQKKNGIHLHWKATLPPLHPRCRCVLQYVPQGASWVDGKLVVSSVQDFSKGIDLVKGGDESTLAAKRKPQGAPSNQVTPGQPNITGAKGSPSPDAKTPPGPKVPSSGAASAPKSSGGGGGASAPKQAKPWAGMDVDYVPKGEASEDQRARAVGVTDNSYVVPKGGGGGGDSAQQDPEKDQAAADEFDKQKKNYDHAKVMAHLSVGDITSYKDTRSDTNASDSWQVRIAGNGHALMKPPQEYLTKSGRVVAGGTAVQHGTSHKREVAAYSLYNMFGMTSHCPPTVTREAPLPTGEKTQVSMQSWASGYKNLSKHLIKTYEGVAASEKPKDLVTGLLKKAPADKKEGLKKKLDEIAIMNILMNHNDGHMNNVMVSEDFSDVIAIDHSSTFANGMDSIINGMHENMHRGGFKLKVPADLMDKFSKTTLKDLQRTLGDQLSDWEVGQTFLRMKYIEHLQKTEGHLDYDKFRKVHGSTEPVDFEKSGPGSFFSRMRDGTTPKMLFESFAKKWITDRTSGRIRSLFDKESRTARELQKIGVFMGAGEEIFQDVASYRAAGEHREAEKRIVPKNPEDLLPTKAIVTDHPEESPPAPLARDRAMAMESPRPSDMVLGPRTGAERPSKKSLPLYIKL